MKKVSSIEEYIEVYSKFSKEINFLRNIINSTELVENLKWSAPVFSIEGKNVLSIGAFKNHLSIMFFNGVFLKDDNKLLQPAAETTKGLRQMRFESMADIDQHAVLSYVKEAVENQKLGKEIKPERQNKDVDIPEELEKVIKDNSVLYDAFKLLSPSKQREYSDYIKSAKRDETKVSRIEKIKPMIVKGIGLHDKYKNC